MYYQLPNGKTVWLDISDVLNLTNEDIQYLVATNMGEVILNPFKNSVLNNKDKPEETDSEDEEETGSEDVDFYYKEFYPDEFPDVKDDNINFDNLDN
jgi:hypothetical protein